MRRTVSKFYRQCEGSKDDKVREIIVFINRLAQMIVKIHINGATEFLITRNFINCTQLKAACVLCRSNLKAKGLANSDIKTSIV